MDPSATSRNSNQHAYPRWSETLGNDGYVRIRPLDARKDPARHMILGFASGEQSFRLVGQADYPQAHVVDSPATIDYVNEVAFVGVTPDDSRERIVGVSRYRTDQDGSRCECVVTVDDDWHKKGLAVLLMKHLMEVARAHGIRRMTSVGLAANVPMRELAKQLGFRTRMDPDDVCQVLHELDL